MNNIPERLSQIDIFAVASFQYSASPYFEELGEVSPDSPTRLPGAGRHEEYSQTFPSADDRPAIGAAPWLWHIIEQRSHVPRIFAIDEHCLIAAAKEVTHRAVASRCIVPCKSSGPRHTADEVCLWSLDHEMIMIPHQDISMNQRPRPPDRLRKRGQEHPAIVVIRKDPLLPVTPAITW